MPNLFLVPGGGCFQSVVILLFFLSVHHLLVQTGVGLLGGAVRHHVVGEGHAEAHGSTKRFLPNVPIFFFKYFFGGFFFSFFPYVPIFKGISIQSEQVPVGFIGGRTGIEAPTTAGGLRPTGMGASSNVSR